MRTVGPAFYCEGRHSKVRDVPRPPAALLLRARARLVGQLPEVPGGEETAHVCRTRSECIHDQKISSNAGTDNINITKCWNGSAMSHQPAAGWGPQLDLCTFAACGDTRQLAGLFTGKRRTAQCSRCQLLDGAAALPQIRRARGEWRSKLGSPLASSSEVSLRARCAMLPVRHFRQGSPGGG